MSNTLLINYNIINHNIIVYFITDIRDMKVVCYTSTLGELGMDSMMAVEIKQTLEREFDLLLTAQEILSLTFAKLIKMSDKNVSDDNIHDIKKLDVKQPDAIKLLFGIVEDRDFISETCIDLCTKRQENSTQVFLIPGIDGCGTVFNHLAPNIKFLASYLNYSTNNVGATNIISETTDHLTNVRNY